MFKVIIAGGRDFHDYDKLKKHCDAFLRDKSDVEIVSGYAAGADSLGVRYATERGFGLAAFPVTAREWDLIGPIAGNLRNAKMAEYADALIAFWNGKSRGTRHMLQQAWLRRLSVSIVSY